MTGTTTFDFRGFITFEMANNHQGDVEHGKRIIREYAAIAARHAVRASVKLQLRDLGTFIHRDFLEDKANKHVPRFLSTKLSKVEFQALVAEMRAHDLVVEATPFDERSVAFAQELGVDVLKVASCSAKDWPLLEAIADANKPVIASTGGLSLEDIDKLVSFFEHRYVEFALMHCVAIYPTPPEKLQLHQVRLLKDRYPHLTIGFSTHEEPDNYAPVQLAYALGARMFERHVGIATDTIKLNGYSSTPEQTEAWLASYERAVAMCGVEGVRTTDPGEVKDLTPLMRGTYAKRDIEQGETVGLDDVFFAFPLQEGQLTSGEFRAGVAADRIYKKRAPLSAALMHAVPVKVGHLVYPIIHEVKGMLRTARVPVDINADVELSHHYGLERFREVGVTIIDCINREYCKKILVQLPGQTHPHHHHLKKEEAFQMLWGELHIELDGRVRTLLPGDVIVVQRGVRHAFWTTVGAIFEEVSTTHYNNDSVYRDKAIGSLPREARKTKLYNWGRFQFD